METPVQFADQKSDNCQKELTAAIVVPVIIILILIILTVTILIVYVVRKVKWYVYVNKCIIVLKCSANILCHDIIHYSHGGRERSSTLKEVTNIQLYTMSR